MKMKQRILIQIQRKWQKFNGKWPKEEKNYNLDFLFFTYYLKNTIYNNKLEVQKNREKVQPYFLNFWLGKMNEKDFIRQSLDIGTILCLIFHYFKSALLTLGRRDDLSFLFSFLILMFMNLTRSICWHVLFRKKYDSNYKSLDSFTSISFKVYNALGYIG